MALEMTGQQSPITDYLLLTATLSQFVNSDLDVTPKDTAIERRSSNKMGSSPVSNFPRAGTSVISAPVTVPGG